MRSDPLAHNQQRGFTLLELLIAMTLMLLLIVAVQLYVAGVVVDQQNISEDHDQTTQTRIALTNIQRDVAQSGFYPFFADPAITLFTPAQLGVLGARLVCVNGMCTGLNVGSIQAVGSAVDCNGNGSGPNGQLTATQFDNGGSFLPGTNVPAFSTDGRWAIVYNQYSIDTQQDELTCRGSGAAASNGYRARLSHLANDNASVLFSAVTNNDLGLRNSIAAPTNRMISLCIVTVENITATPVTPINTDCAGDNLAAPAVGKAHVKTRIDMPVIAESFIAGAPP